MTGLIIVIDAGGQIELRLGPESRLLRERLGMTAWVALEALVLAAARDGRGRLAAATSARDLATKLGVGKDRAAAALAVLRESGLLVPIASSTGRSGRFVAHRYEIRLPVSRETDAVRSAGRAEGVGDARRGARGSRATVRGRVVNVVFVMSNGFVARLGDRHRCRRAFIETIGWLPFDSRGDEFNGFVHRCIVDAGHGLVGFLVSFATPPLRIETAC